MKILSLFLCLFLWSVCAQAYEKSIARQCKGTKVPCELAIAVAKQESGMNPLCINVEGKDFTPGNREEAVAIIKKAQAEDKSYDVGLMQINSQWVKIWKIDPVVLLDPETNIKYGLKILRDEIARHGLNWRAVARYHSPNPLRGRQYAGMVSRRLKGNALLKSRLSNPRMRNPFIKMEPLNIMTRGPLGQSPGMRAPVGIRQAARKGNFPAILGESRY